MDFFEDLAVLVVFGITVFLATSYLETTVQMDHFCVAQKPKASCSCESSVGTKAFKCKLKTNGRAVEFLVTPNKGKVWGN